MVLVPDITASSDQVRNALCRIAQFVDNDGSAPGIAHQLNELIELLA